ncbi:hypothetical protein A2U01_0092763, partial [Trifolium medium]|nr:hypothetical protein [Trifolium medium]
KFARARCKARPTSSQEQASLPGLAARLARRPSTNKRVFCGGLS